MQEIAEQKERVDRTRTACGRLIDAYNFQLDMLELQDKLSVSQKATASLNAEMSIARMAHDGYGARTLSTSEVADLSSINIPPRIPVPGNPAAGSVSLAPPFTTSTSARDAIRLLQEITLTLSEESRIQYKKQVLEIDFKGRFDDANEAISLSLHELGRLMMTLDRSTPAIVADRSIKSDYVQLSWIRQGTVVLETRRW